MGVKIINAVRTVLIVVTLWYGFILYMLWTYVSLLYLLLGGVALTLSFVLVVILMASHNLPEELISETKPVHNVP